MRHRNARPRTEGEAQARERALATLALMRRENLSLEAAANAVGTDPRTVLRYVGSALRHEGPGGDYQAIPHDRIPRTLHFITAAGPTEVTVHDSRTASRIAEHMNAVRTYLRTGDSSALKSFRGESFEAGGLNHQFVTDPDTLDKLADAGVLAMEGLYRVAHGG